MDEPLRILIVEDLPSDVEIVKREIRKAEINCIFRCVDTKEEFITAMDEFNPEFILSDYSLPQFDGMQALQIAKGYNQAIPFIIVTGSMNEETAVACIKAGAEDYVIKEHIRQLAPALHAAMVNKQNLIAKLEAEKALRLNEQHMEMIVEMLPDGILIVDNDYTILFANKKSREWLAPKDEEIIGTKFSHNLDLSKIIECDIILTEGIPGKAEITAVNIKWDNEPAFLVTLHNVTKCQQV